MMILEFMIMIKYQNNFKLRHYLFQWLTILYYTTIKTNHYSFINAISTCNVILLKS